MYYCTCKARAASGHSEAGAHNVGKDGSFTYYRAANGVVLLRILRSSVYQFLIKSLTRILALIGFNKISRENTSGKRVASQWGSRADRVRAGKMS